MKDKMPIMKVFTAPKNFHIIHDYTAKTRKYDSAARDARREIFQA
jgi:hypothetical protein